MYLNGDIDSMTYYLDFPYEVETRYKKLLRESRELAVMIYDCLVEEGTNLYDDLTEKEFESKITREYEFVRDVYQGDVDII